MLWISKVICCRSPILAYRIIAWIDKKHILNGQESNHSHLAMCSTKQPQQLWEWQFWVHKEFVKGEVVADQYG